MGLREENPLINIKSIYTSKTAFWVSLYHYDGDTELLGTPV